MFGKVTNARAVITNKFLEYEICAMFAMGRNRTAWPRLNVAAFPHTASRMLSITLRRIVFSL
jgi:hypothetical protein